MYGHMLSLQFTKWFYYTSLVFPPFFLLTTALQVSVLYIGKNLITSVFQDENYLSCAFYILCVCA